MSVCKGFTTSDVTSDHHPPMFQEHGTRWRLRWYDASLLFVVVWQIALHFLDFDKKN